MDRVTIVFRPCSNRVTNIRVAGSATTTFYRENRFIVSVRSRGDALRVIGVVRENLGNNWTAITPDGREVTETFTSRSNAAKALVIYDNDKTANLFGKRQTTPDEFFGSFSN